MTQHPPEMSQEEFDRLFRVARSALGRLRKSSLFLNLADDIAQQSVFEYWRAVQRGTEVENPEAYVTTIAKRRGRDAELEWKRRRDQRFGVGEDAEGEMAVPRELMPEAADVMPGTLEIIEDLESAARDGGDSLDALIAQRILIDGETPEEVAAEFGLAVKTVRNRMTAIKDRLRAHLDAD